MVVVNRMDVAEWMWEILNINCITDCCNTAICNLYPKWNFERGGNGKNGRRALLSEGNLLILHCQNFDCNSSVFAEASKSVSDL